MKIQQRHILDRFFTVLALSSIVLLVFLAVSGEKRSILLRETAHSSSDAPSIQPVQKDPTVEPTVSPTVSPTMTSTQATIPTMTITEAPSKFPTMRPTKAPVGNIDDELVCGCDTCNESVWNSYAGVYKCGSRIQWLVNYEGLSERDACSKVARFEYPLECGGCDPDNCVNNSPSGQKCGAAVDIVTLSESQQVCQSDLWDPTDDPTMHCFAFGGSGNPCHLDNNNNPDDDLFKDPSACSGDTFFLWKEPERNGRSYDWAGKAWLEYSQRFPDELRELRARGTKIASPTLKAGAPGEINVCLRDFFTSCGSACIDKNNPAHVDVIAIDAFCGGFSETFGCRDEAALIYDAAVEASGAFGDLPVYITSWSRLKTSRPWDQLEAIYAIDKFFNSSATSDPVVERVYWFGATNLDESSSNNSLSEVLIDGSTLGEHLRKKCDTL
eukprot:jgi/Psemu1/196558/e_gw1.189.22.1